MRKLLNVIVVWAILLLLPIVGKPAESKSLQKSTQDEPQAIPESKYRELFDRYLSTHLGKEKSEVVVSRFKVTGDKTLPPGKINFHLYQRDRGTLEGYVNLAVIVNVDGIPRHEVKLSGWVDVFRSVICTSRPLRKGEVIREEDISLKKNNVSHHSPHSLTDTKRVIGFMVKHNLNENTCLKEWMLEKPPVLSKGDSITILAELHGLRITALGKARERGYLGEMIRVQNSMSNKEIFARVVDDSTVRVEF